MQAVGEESDRTTPLHAVAVVTRGGVTVRVTNPADPGAAGTVLRLTLDADEVLGMAEALRVMRGDADGEEFAEVFGEMTYTDLRDPVLNSK